MLIDGLFEIVEPTMIENMFEVFADFGVSGHQIVLLTADRGVFSQGTNRAKNFSSNSNGVNRLAVFELPQTRVSPGPAITPDRSLPFEPPRQPEFLTPFTIRHSHMQDFAREYPMVKYPPLEQIDSHEIHHFENLSPVAPVVSNIAPAATTPTAPIFVKTPSPIYVPDGQVRAVTPFPAEQPVRTSAHYRGQKISNDVFENSAITENTDLRTIDLVDSIHLGQLSQSGISSVRSLLELVPDSLPQSVTIAGVTPEQIDRWQAQAWLMICVPGLSTVDARILAAIGVAEPEQLDASNSSQLLQRVQRFMNSPNGSRFKVRGDMIDMNRVNMWMRSLDRTRSSWRKSRGYSRRNRWGQRSSNSRQQNAAEASAFQRAPRIRTSEPQRRERDVRSRDVRTRDDRSYSDREPVTRQPKLHTASLAKTTKTKRNKRATSALKFYLELDSDLEAAPSIGPKTAERFERVGVTTVREFLNQTAESMSSKIQYKRMTADVIRQWQHHARLVCRIPNLRGHDAQLLVACGITEPEDLAVKQPENLFNVIGPFSETKEGLKIIRNGKKPDLDEITDWINWAGHTRSLQAA